MAVKKEWSGSLCNDMEVYVWYIKRKQVSAQWVQHDPISLFYFKSLYAGKELEGHAHRLLTVGAGRGGLYIYIYIYAYMWRFPCGSAGKESACNEGDRSLIPGLGRSPGEGKGYPLQYSGLGNSMDCIVHGVAKSWTHLSNFHNNNNSAHTHTHFHVAYTFMMSK